jgi:hypothetical protein
MRAAVQVARPTPLSWLVLERYALGELSERARCDVERQLAVSAHDRACLALIFDDRSQLSVLKVSARRHNVALAWLVAACVLLVRVPSAHDLVTPASRQHTKGGDVAMALLSDRSGHAAHGFAAQERFKVLFTSPRAFARPLHVLVFQGAHVFEPLARAQHLESGNLVPFPGAFSLDGDQPADVCVTWSSAANARSAAELGDDAVCTTLAPRATGAEP